MVAGNLAAPRDFAELRRQFSAEALAEATVAALAEATVEVAVAAMAEATVEVPVPVVVACRRPTPQNRSVRRPKTPWRRRSSWCCRSCC